MKENRMGTQGIQSLLISMSLPIVISMIIQAMYNIVDSIFVAQINEAALTAVSMSFPIQNLMIAIATGTAVGINALLSRNLGAKKFEAANQTANNGLFLAFMSYLLFLIFGFIGVTYYFKIQSTDAQIIDYGVTYLKICSFFSFGLFFQIVFERLMQATGKSIYSMITQGLGAILNIVLDPILIFGLFGMPKMGVAGAAAATVIGQIIAAITGLIINHTLNKEIKVSIRGFKPDFQTIKEIYVVGIPSIIMISITSISTYVINNILNKFSSTAVAAFGVYFKLQSFVFMPVFGINNGMIPIIAYNYGARKKDRIIETIKLAILGGMALMTFGFIIFQLFPTDLLKLFNASENMISIGRPALKIVSISFLSAGFTVVSSAVFQALGNGVLSMVLSMARQLIVLIPLAFLFSLKNKVDLVWWAFPLAEVAAMALCIYFLRRIIIDKVDKIGESI